MSIYIISFWFGLVFIANPADADGFYSLFNSAIGRNGPKREPREPREPRVAAPKAVIAAVASSPEPVRADRERRVRKSRNSER